MAVFGRVLGVFSTVTHFATECSAPLKQVMYDSTHMCGYDNPIMLYVNSCSADNVNASTEVGGVTSELFG